MVQVSSSCIARATTGLYIWQVEPRVTYGQGVAIQGDSLAEIIRFVRCIGTQLGQLLPAPDAVAAVYIERFAKLIM
ncbi:MAG: hypothetical protein ETSY1_36840 [Candidatus Entotheonella factor]|uniref:Uncharacterized protein n=1 Tax=Entotheonella factor TaxID=1429438 RepID=W4L7D5_ENTF1|nr:MAG: hypothetical protein ETSY1_36840 [Candidatus Entotheonella factor]